MASKEASLHKTSLTPRRMPPSGWWQGLQARNFGGGGGVLTELPSIQKPFFTEHFPSHPC